MSRRNQVIWAVCFAAATALTISGMQAKDAAELNHGEAGMYRLMPGFILGLLSGFALDSPIVVIAVTIAANAAVYCFTVRGVMWLWAKTVRRSSPSSYERSSSE